MSYNYSSVCDAAHEGDPQAIIREIRMQVRELMTQGPRLPHQIVLGARQNAALEKYICQWTVAWITPSSFPVNKPCRLKYDGLEVVVLPMSGVIVV